MCGIAGVWNPSPEARERIRASAALLRHRGPDGEGFLDTPHCVVAHRRLSIVDVSGGAQPLFNEERAVALAYNGEIYNHKALCSRLRKRHCFGSQSDGEVILHLYEEDGESCIRELHGMFALALIEPRRLVLARDPLGIKPLYWAREGASVAFASEIKALEGLCDPARIEEFPPGHFFTTDKGLVPYWTLEDGIATAGSGAAETSACGWEGILLQELEASVRQRLMADVPVGVFLSGGLDSSLIAALMRPHVQELHSFAVGAPGSPDLVKAALVARHLKTMHHETHITPEEIQRELPAIIYHLESFDPDLVQSAVPCYFVSREAAKHVKVVLTGEGADELFAGYGYYSHYDHDCLHRELCRSIKALHNINLQRVDRMSMAHGLEARVPFLDAAFATRAMCIPAELKHSSEAAKYILRKASENLLPAEIVWRRKEQFDHGSGSAAMLASLGHGEEDYRRMFLRRYPLATERLVCRWNAARLRTCAQEA